MSILAWVTMKAWYELLGNFVHWITLCITTILHSYGPFKCIHPSVCIHVLVACYQLKCIFNSSMFLAMFVCVCLWLCVLLALFGVVAVCVLVAVCVCLFVHVSVWVCRCVYVCFWIILLINNSESYVADEALNYRTESLVPQCFSEFNSALLETILCVNNSDFIY